MPELPEVETIRRALAPALRRRVITGIQVRRADAVGHPGSARAFARRLSGRRIQAVVRQGKYLRFKLSGGAELVVHLRLSGKLALVNRTERPRHERVRLDLGPELALSFVEPRALGRLYLLEPGEKPPVLAGMRALGLEPTTPEFDSAYLTDRLKGRTASVKSLLLDQRICCGVGNIYSDEALFRAGIRPTRPAGSLSRLEVSRLVRALRRVLKDGIRWGGTTMPDRGYLRPDGRAGGFQDRLAVFGREGQKCRRCRSRVAAARVAGRTSRYCPSCQK